MKSLSVAARRPMLAGRPVFRAAKGSNYPAACRPSACGSPRSPHTWGPTTSSTIRRPGLRRACPRGHDVVIAAPSDSRAAIRASRAAIREIRAEGGSGGLSGWHGERGAAQAGRRCWRSARACRCREGRDRGRRRCRSTSAGPSRAALRVGVRHRPRARPLRAERGFARAAPLARPERRQLPRADRANPLHPGRPAARGDLLRAPRCADTSSARHERPPAPLLPRPVHAGRAGRRRSPRAVARRGAAAGRARRGSRSAPSRSGARCVSSCGRCAQARSGSGLGGGDLDGEGHPPPVRLAPALRERVHITGPTSSRPRS